MNRSHSFISLMEPKGTIAFSTVGLLSYGFDIFSTDLPENLLSDLTERRHTDAVSVNFNAQFADETGQTVSFVSERTGSSQLYQTVPTGPEIKPLLTNPTGLFHDRPTIKNNRVFYVSAHEPPSDPFKSWAAVYQTRFDTQITTRLTPTGFVDFSPAVSESGELIAVASYGSDTWKGDFQDLNTDIIIFNTSDPNRRTKLAGSGGWPTFAGESKLFFHRKSEDKWWSIYKIDLNENGKICRITPPGIHAFTPAASHDGKYIAIATRRKGIKHRHIEIFDLESEQFYQISSRLNPNLHHYNPFFSPDSKRIGYHRFRGGSSEKIPNILTAKSPILGLNLVRIHGTFPSFSPDGNFVAINGDFFESPGLMIIKSDGSKRWNLLKSPTAFYTAWSPVEKGVLFSSIGPIFESSKTTVEIARISFNLEDLNENNTEIVPEVKILTRKGTANNAFPSCSPDGKKIVFRSGRFGNKNLYIVDSVDGEFAGKLAGKLAGKFAGVQRLTEGNWVDTMPAWSPDGSLIAFSSNRHNPSSLESFSIYLVGPDGSNLRRVYVAGPMGSSEANRERINHVCFSPDSKWLLFTANLGSVLAESVSMPNHFQPYGDLWICRLDGSGLTRLTCNAYENGTPAWHGSDWIDGGGGFGCDTMSGPIEEPLWLTCDI